MVLLDMNMPKMNGFEFLTAMKDHENGKEIPVVIISSKNREECGLEDLSERVNGFINKRYAAEGIHEIIRELFPRAA